MGKNNAKHKLIYMLLLVAMTFLTSLPAFRSGTIIGHDLPFHLGRIEAISQELMAGQLPIRYESQAWYGHGYVSSLFYGHLFMYVPALLHLAGLPVFRAYNIFVILVNFATALVSYYSFKRLLKNDNRFGLLATMIYMFAGYRLSNVYLRCAVGEYLAMIFLPLFMLGISQVYESSDAAKQLVEKNPEIDSHYRAKINFEDKERFFVRISKMLNLPLIISTTAIIESHVLTTELVLIFVALFALIMLKRTIKNIVPLLLNLLVIVLINLYFIWPFISSYTSMELFVNASATVPNLKGNGLYFSQIFNPLTGGFGGNTVWSTETEGYLNMGITIVLAMFATVVAWISDVRENTVDFKMFVVGFLGLVALWASTVYFPWQLFVYDNALCRLVTSIQYPSRNIMLATACFTLTGTYGFKRRIELWAQKRNVKPSKIVLFHLRTDNLLSIYINKSFLVVASAVFVLAVAMTAYFDYTLVCRNYTTTNVTADADWADKLYLPQSTDAKLLTDENAHASVKDNTLTLPVLAYDHIKVYTNAGDEITWEKGANNCVQVALSDTALSTKITEDKGDVAISPQDLSKELQVKYVEPLSWRIAEALSLACLIALVIIRGFFNKNEEYYHVVC